MPLVKRASADGHHCTSHSNQRELADAPDDPCKECPTTEHQPTLTTAPTATTIVTPPMPPAGGAPADDPPLHEEQ